MYFVSHNYIHTNYARFFQGFIHNYDRATMIIKRWSYNLHASDLEIIFLSQQSLLNWNLVCEWLGFVNRLVTRPNVFPSPSASNIVLSLSVWHSALSVQHIEAADRKRGSWICLKFSFFFLHLTRLIYPPPPHPSFSKTDNSDLSFHLRGFSTIFWDLRMGTVMRVIHGICWTSNICHQISAPKEWIGYHTIVRCMSNICSTRDSAHAFVRI